MSEESWKWTWWVMCCVLFGLDNSWFNHTRQVYINRTRRSCQRNNREKFRWIRSFGTKQAYKEITVPRRSIRIGIQRHYSLSGKTSREVSKSRDSGLDFSNPSGIWQAPRQQCCRNACQMSERYDHYSIKSRGFETSRDRTVRRPPAYQWIEAQKAIKSCGAKWNHAWWRHQMETISALLALCVGNSPVTGEFPAQRPVTRSFDVFCDLRLHGRLSKQS